MAFCTKCGTEIPENATECPGCGEKVGGIKKKIKIDPFAAIAAVFSVMAFLFGFILTTTFFVSGVGVQFAQYISFVPALVSLAAGIVCLCNHEKVNKGSKIASLISLVLDSFAIFYVFVGCMVLSA